MTTTTQISIAQLQTLLEQEWLPVIMSIQYEFDTLDDRVDMKPHVGYDGYIPFVDGGGVYSGMITGNTVMDNGWFKTTIGPDYDKYFREYLDDGGDEEEAREYYGSSESCSWLKCRCLVREGDDGTWEAEFDSFICTDSYGRDSISWLKYMGGKSDQTIGSFCEVIHQSQFNNIEQLRQFLKNVAQQQVDYLIRLRDTDDYFPVVCHEPRLIEDGA